MPSSCCACAEALTLGPWARADGTPLATTLAKEQTAAKPKNSRSLMRGRPPYAHPIRASKQALQVAGVRRASVLRWGLLMRSTEKPPLVLDRYVLFDRIASGGMASVHIGRFAGDGGFLRTVAVKRLHPHFAGEEDFVAMFMDEARLAARIRHPNVVPTLDVVANGQELFLVMEYVVGEALSRLIRSARNTLAADSFARPPLEVVSALMCGVLEGLHAAHEAKDDAGVPLGIVHRDVSPQNVLVGADGVARVLDFGIARAASQIHSSQGYTLRGKLAYMAPEQVARQRVGRTTDIFAAAVVLWEALTCHRLFEGDEVSLVQQVLTKPIPAPSSIRPDISPALDEVVLKALERDPARRYQSAKAMAMALEDAITPATPRRVSEWVVSLAGEALAERERLVAGIERERLPAPKRPGETTARGEVPLGFLSEQVMPYEGGETSTSLYSANIGTGAGLSLPDSQRRLAAELPRSLRWAFAVGLGLFGMAVGFGLVRSRHKREVPIATLSPAPAPPSEAREVPDASVAIAAIAASTTSAPAVPAPSGATTASTKPVKPGVRGASPPPPPPPPPPKPTVCAAHPEWCSK